MDSGKAGNVPAFCFIRKDLISVKIMGKALKIFFRVFRKLRFAEEC